MQFTRDGRGVDLGQTHIKVYPSLECPQQIMPRALNCGFYMLYFAYFAHAHFGYFMAAVDRTDGISTMDCFIDRGESLQSSDVRTWVYRHIRDYIEEA